MTLPISTTTITVYARHVEAVDQWSEGYADDDAAEPDDTPPTRATGIRATISKGAAGTFGNSGPSGEMQSTSFYMVCDPTELDYLDTIKDETTGLVYSVEWVTETPGVAGLGHMQVGLSANEGGRT